MEIYNARTLVIPLLTHLDPCFSSSQSQNILLKWLFKLKLNFNGDFAKKDHIIAQGYQQEPHINFD